MGGGRRGLKSPLQIVCGPPLDPSKSHPGAHLGVKVGDVVLGDERGGPKRGPGAHLAVEVLQTRTDLHLALQKSTVADGKGSTGDVKGYTGDGKGSGGSADRRASRWIRTPAGSSVESRRRKRASSPTTDRESRYTVCIKGVGGLPRWHIGGWIDAPFGVPMLRWVK
eukprot:857865-Pyramimonas_sp.AAC.1